VIFFFFPGVKVEILVDRLPRYKAENNYLEGRDKDLKGRENAPSPNRSQDGVDVLVVTGTETGTVAPQNPGQEKNHGPGSLELLTEAGSKK